MNPAQKHYDQLLGAVYTWMAGGFDAALARNRQMLVALGPASWPRGLAVDLGCGSGFQSIPLAEAGYQVLGVDLCEPLLAELRVRAGQLSIRTVRDDLLNFPAHLDAAPTLVVCMGDTLPHLPSLDAVRTLVSTIAHRLAPGGRVMLGFRDLATHELTGTQRFIPVRSEPDRVFTCFLDYQPGRVEVHDLLYTREGDGWKFNASSYTKLRLNAASVAALLTEAGLVVELASTEQGLVRLIARAG